jgi:hypothetical protein
MAGEAQSSMAKEAKEFAKGVELMPTLAELPQLAQEHALQRLNSMMPQDLARTAQRLRDTQPLDWRRAADEEAMRFAEQIFGS